ncbi:SPL family radical SAM protein [Bacillus suaedae]|uniref:Radical SAM protein n=1 Tax=Halalkalibacter suaedae TaxID=2822140 RepID=A0A941AU13_9BACI|nr:radical SAM protein [Bacillus suaedae]MBP3953279.1 radical SAM protein [Bacillus suaedae]
MSSVNVNYKEPKKILTPTSGFLYGYSHSLNPYSGCSFACSYCYVRQSPVGLFRNEEWGTWIDIKQGVQEKITKEINHLKKRGKPVTIFMSSSTDPYQPVEYKEKVTRTLLEAMVETPPDFLFVQTRSPLVTRDIDLFEKLSDRLRISMTIETDRDEIRKVFSPSAPPIQARLKAIRQLQEHNLPTQVAIAPILPFSEDYPRILSTVVDRVVVDDFTGDGSQGKRTERLKIKELYPEENIDMWYGPTTLATVIGKMKAVFEDDQVFISQDGFMPF